jgi:hypothetical protein
VVSVDTGHDHAPVVEPGQVVHHDHLLGGHLADRLGSTRQLAPYAHVPDNSHHGK